MSKENLPILNIFIRFGEIGRQTSTLTEIGPNFACFFAPKKFFGKAPPKFRPGILKKNILRSRVQNFAAIGQLSLKITQREKKKIYTTAKLKSASASYRLRAD